METPVLVVFDDRTARAWRPFTLTRPAGELLFGGFTLRARAERVFGLPCLGHIVPGGLDGFEEHDAPPALDPAAVPVDRPRLFLSSRAVPAWPVEPPVLGDEPALVVVGGEPAGWWAPARSPAPDASFLEDPQQHAPDGMAVLRFEGLMLRHVWELVVRSSGQVARDVAALFADAPAPSAPAGVHLIGDDALILGADVQLEPGVVLDTREGPIWLESGVRVRSFTRLCGPAYIGRDSVLEGGSLSGVTVGPVCHLHGEVEETVVLGYSNKHHEGFLGHAYLGRWVNLGAFTTNSNLKNNYDTIDLWTPDGPRDTGELKMGCLIGDHVKTGIGTLLNTGTVVEAACNLFGNEMPPKYVAPFSWGTGSALVEYDCERFLQMAETAMSRRNVTLTDGLKRLLRAVAAARANGARP